MNKVLDLFALGAAYRTRSDEDVILLFKNAYDENPVLALKCLFYLRDVRGGQGERRFFRVILRWLATYGRWDDIYVLFDTPVEEAALALIKHQLALDTQTEMPSLLAKWLPSENASSAATRSTGRKIRKYLGITQRQYRKVLSALREKINIVERLMSENSWDKIEFDKVPSKAGLQYKKAFARHEVERYRNFIQSDSTTVNAGALYPYEVVDKAKHAWNAPLNDTDRLAVNKYWDNLKNYFDDKEFNGLAVVDTSGSMTWYGGAACPLNVAISLGMYCAERAKGPFAGHFVSFSTNPQLIKVEGVDFCDKVRRICKRNECSGTDIERTFDMLLDTAIKYKCEQNDLPKFIIAVSDMEFDEGTDYCCEEEEANTLMEQIRLKWHSRGYVMPKLIYWNVQARQNLIPDSLGCGNVSFVSGMSPAIFDSILSGKSGVELMLDKLNSKRYEVIC